MIRINWFDIVLVVILLWSAAMGLRSGFARVVVGTIATLIGLFAGFWCYRLVAVKLAPVITGVSLANILGFLLIFMAALILGSLIASLFGRIFRWMGLSWFDHLLGGIAGLLRGAFIVAAIVDMVIAYAPSPVPRVLEHSQVLPYVSEVSGWLVSLAPRDLRDAFTEQMNNLKQFWANPSPSPEGSKV